MSGTCRLHLFIAVITTYVLILANILTARANDRFTPRLNRNSFTIRRVHSPDAKLRRSLEVRRGARGLLLGRFPRVGTVFTHANATRITASIVPPGVSSNIMLLGPRSR